jgi:hypothetical protein
MCGAAPDDETPPSAHHPRKPSRPRDSARTPTPSASAHAVDPPTGTRRHTRPVRGELGGDRRATRRRARSSTGARRPAARPPGRARAGHQGRTSPPDHRESRAKRRARPHADTGGNPSAHPRPHCDAGGHSSADPHSDTGGNSRSRSGAYASRDASVLASSRSPRRRILPGLDREVEPEVL